MSDNERRKTNATSGQGSSPRDRAETAGPPADDPHQVNAPSPGSTTPSGAGVSDPVGPDADPPNYADWLARPIWTLAEAAILFTCRDPDRCLQPHDQYFRSLPRDDVSRAIAERSAHHSEIGILPVVYGWGTGFGDYAPFARAIRTVAALPQEHLAWAVRERMPIANPLHGAAKEALATVKKSRPRQLTWPGPIGYRSTEDEPDYELYVARGRLTLCEGVFLVHGQTPVPDPVAAHKFLVAMSTTDPRAFLFRAASQAVRNRTLAPLRTAENDRYYDAMISYPNGGADWVFPAESILRFLAPLATPLPPKLRALLIGGAGNGSVQSSTAAPPAPVANATADTSATPFVRNQTPTVDVLSPAAPSDRSIRVPAGTAWNNVSFCLHDDSLEVEIAGTTTTWDLLAAGLSMADNPSRFNASGRALISLATSGSFPQRGEDAKATSRNEKTASVLGQSLKKMMMGIPGEPLDLRDGRYAPRFVATYDGVERWRAPAGTTWREVVIERVGEFVFRVSNENAVSPPYDWSIEFTLSDLELTGKHDRPSKAGFLLIDTCQKRRIPSSKEYADVTVLSLGKLLSDRLQIEGDPMAQSPTGPGWVPVFTPTSAIPDGAVPKR